MVDFDDWDTYEYDYDYAYDHYDDDLCIECGRISYYEAVCDECAAGL